VAWALVLVLEEDVEEEEDTSLEFLELYSE
jgi:hypothetical protein